jgi:hypothetical protein
LERETILAERYALRKEQQERKKAKARLSRNSGKAKRPESKADKLSAKKRELEMKYEEEEEEGEVATAPRRRESGIVIKASTTSAQEQAEVGDSASSEPATYDDALKVQGFILFFKFFFGVV